MQGDFEAEENGHLVLYIDGRSPGSKLASPEQISKTLRNQVMSEDFQRAITRVLSSASARAEVRINPETKLFLEVPLNFQGSEEDLDKTLAGLEKLFTALTFLPKKPVLVLGEAQILAAIRFVPATSCVDIILCSLFY